MDLRYLDCNGINAIVTEVAWLIEATQTVHAADEAACVAPGFQRWRGGKQEGDAFTLQP